MTHIDLMFINIAVIYFAAGFLLASIIWLSLIVHKTGKPPRGD